jgi:hypothetical protein
MKVLFFTSSEEDYLSDSLLIGLRQILGENCVDYPKRDILYSNCSQKSLSLVRGYGFTLYTGLLEDIEIDRFSIRPKLVNKYFDLVIFSDIWRQFGFYCQWRMNFEDQKTIFLDGQDVEQVYPFAGLWGRRPYLWFVPQVSKNSLYFKREWTSNSQFNWWHRLIPDGLRSHLPHPQNLRLTGFSFPEEKIIKNLPKKTKLFPRHIVDLEVAGHVTDSVTKYAFDSEDDYYADLQASKFGITTKRAGWDCLRHYEIAANGCVPCFRDLDKKPITCAPHGLNETNCIIYHDYNDLINKIHALSEEEYQKLQHSSLEWAKANSTIERAKQLLSSLNFDPLD